jgi:hypothetical protein
LLLLELRFVRIGASPKKPAIRRFWDVISPILPDFSPTTLCLGRTVAMRLVPLTVPDPPMLIHATRPLFAWSELEDTP